MKDHARGCPGREYACTCGYDDNRDALIRDLTAALWAIVTDEDELGYEKQRIAHNAIARAREANG
jgi:hypothetical protein